MSLMIKRGQVDGDHGSEPNIQKDLLYFDSSESNN